MGSHCYGIVENNTRFLTVCAGLIVLFSMVRVRLFIKGRYNISNVGKTASLIKYAYLL